MRERVCICVCVCVCVCMAGWYCLRKYSLVSGVARFAKLLGMAGFTSVCGLEHENLRNRFVVWFGDPHVEKHA